MTGEHSDTCVKAFSSCLCNICVYDSVKTATPCCKTKFPGERCPVEACPYFKPDSCGTEVAMTIIDEMEGAE